MIVEFKQAISGKGILINTNKIETITQHDENECVIIMDGRKIFVSGSLDEIHNKIISAEDEVLDIFRQINETIKFK